MSAQHTPGPFLLGEWEDGQGNAGLYVTRSDGTEVADNVTPDEARLIAAAPELLAALEEIAEGCTSARGDGLYPMRKDQVAAIARAAIAKARGQ